jgi:hypothetical protein
VAVVGVVQDITADLAVVGAIPVVAVIVARVEAVVVAPDPVDRAVVEVLLEVMVAPSVVQTHALVVPEAALATTSLVIRL